MATRELDEFLSKFKLEIRTKVWYPVPSDLSFYMTYFGWIQREHGLKLIEQTAKKMLKDVDNYNTKKTMIQTRTIFMLWCQKRMPVILPKVLWLNIILPLVEDLSQVEFSCYTNKNVIDITYQNLYDQFFCFIDILNLSYGSNWSDTDGSLLHDGDYYWHGSVKPQLELSFTRDITYPDVDFKDSPLKDIIKKEEDDWADLVRELGRKHRRLF